MKGFACEVNDEFPVGESPGGFMGCEVDSIGKEVSFEGCRYVVIIPHVRGRIPEDDDSRHESSTSRNRREKRRRHAR